jgi:predicted transcriptional regulator
MFSGSKKRLGLSPLEQHLMNHIWANPGCSADQCRAGLDQLKGLKDSTVRTMLRRLEDKGYLTHTVEGRTYLYRAVADREIVAADAVRSIVDRFCGGSVEQLLVGMVDNDVIDPAELEQLARRIALRKERK